MCDKENKGNGYRKNGVNFLHVEKLITNMEHLDVTNTQCALIIALLFGGTTEEAMCVVLLLKRNTSMAAVHAANYGGNNEISDDST